MRVFALIVAETIKPMRRAPALVACDSSTTAATPIGPAGASNIRTDRARIG